LAAGSLGALVAFAIKLPVLIAALLWFHTPVSWEWLLLPVGLAAILASGMALACVTLPVSLVLLDVRYGVPLVQYAFLLATPVFYVMPNDGFVAQVNRVNPLTYLVPAVRDLATGGGGPMPVLAAAAGAALLLALALRYFGKRIGLVVAYIGL
jgi:ABC-type polysaccharide/polyol phosphate export permease